MTRFSFRSIHFVGLLVMLGFALATAEDAVTLLPLPASFSSLGQRVLVNWSKGVIVADGRGRSGADLSDAQAEVRGVQAARTDALRVLAAGVAVLPVTSEVTLEDCMNNSGALRSRIDALVRGALPVQNSERVEKQSDGSRLVSASMSVALYGKSGVLGAIAADLRVACLKSAPRPTGLIVDARGLGARPCFVPKVLAASGVLWDAAGVALENPDLVGGSVVFVRSLEEARKLEARVGASPLVLRADAVSGEGRCDLRLVDADADRFRSSRLESLLVRARVVMVF
jgi:hypothetical protein